MNKNKIFIFAVLFLANSLLTHASNNNEDEIRKTNIPKPQQTQPTQPKNGGNQKVGQNNIDVGDVNFDGFGKGNNKNKNKNKGGEKKY